MSKLLSSEPLAADLGLALLRISSGLSMLWQHGWPKLVNFTDRMDHFSDPIGMGSTLSLALIVFAETICAALVALGLWTRLSTVPLIIGMGVVVFVSKSGQAFAEKELALCYLLAFAAIFFTGSGRFSLDRLKFQ